MTEEKRTLFEILEMVRQGRAPDYEELYYAILALDALHTFDLSALRRLAQKYEESFTRIKTAMDTPPKKWIGWENDPANPNYQSRREAALKLIDRYVI